MRTSAKTVLISGGGVAGPALAHFLSRQGFVPTVVERAPAPRAEGFRIELSAQGLTVLDRMGLHERVHAVSGAPPNATIVYGDGPEIGIPSWAGGGRAIARDRLCSLLHKEGEQAAEYLFDDSITALHEDDEGVLVGFENREPRRFDLVVGADGLHSNVRGLLFGTTTEDHAFFLGTNLAIFTVDNHTGQKDSTKFHVWPYRGSAVTTFPGNTDLEGMFLFRSLRPVESQGMRQAEVKDFVERVHSDLGGHVPDLLRAMRGTRVHMAPSQQIRMQEWHRGRVVLLGDAAHCPDPMTGMGSVLALLGAMALAGELAHHDGDHVRAFAAYREAMRPHVDAAHKVGPLSTGFAAPRTGRGGIRMRSGVMRASLAALKVAGKENSGAGDPFGTPPEFPFDRYTP
ncbi:FAD-dependent monooxygenase [Nocardiopsis sp. HNM0947]|uniref:FAD-dependent monooxygenase n=1 Tax=Nocardiopsis coralli TaxID=2772213 RepID=A0ABR9P2R5_9ACTN|nr:FAD-dependent monooxygenase [Nocardiopsis coralli]MBE2998136.1 FAD-dependent monooxygenase [Nocardiopsis coralli]